MLSKLSVVVARALTSPVTPSSTSHQSKRRLLQFEPSRIHGRRAATGVHLSSLAAEVR